MAIYLQPNCLVVSGSKLLTSDEIHIIRNYLHINCAEYGLQKLFYPPHRERFKPLIYCHSVKKLFNTNHCKWWNSCNGIRHTSDRLWIWVET